MNRLCWKLGTGAGSMLHWPPDKRSKPGGERRDLASISNEKEEGEHVNVSCGTRRTGFMK